MAEKKPAAKAPSTRKKTTKRGPTKAAALKALGLTQADLDRLKAQSELEKKTEAQQESKTAVFTSVAAPVTGAIINENAEVEPEPVPEPKGFFARNLHNTDTTFRLSRQSDKTKARTELKPRGQRGDMVKLTDADLEDENLITQVNYSLIEIIPAAEARRVIEKQSINMQEQVHPAFAILRNPKGEEYAEGAIDVTPRPDPSITVAHLKPQGGEAGEIQFNKQGGGIDRNYGVSGNAGVGGNPAIVSDGFATDQAKDDAARRAGNLDEALGGLSFGGVEETKRT